MPRHSSQMAGNTTSERQWFATTHWSVVLASGQNDSSNARRALERLCCAYWPPLYSYVRRQGHSPQDAQDLTQAFFEKLLEKNFCARADPQKGRFRSFLLTALTQFVADQRDRARAAKRGGGAALIPLDEQTGEEHFLQSLGQNLSPEQQFDKQWALRVVEQARVRLRQECAASGKAELLERVNLMGDGIHKSLTYADIAQELGMSVSAIKSAVSRLRERYGELVREEVAHTVASPAEVPAEIGYLLSIIGV